MLTSISIFYLAGYGLKCLHRIILSNSLLRPNCVRLSYKKEVLHDGKLLFSVSKEMVCYTASCRNSAKDAL